MSKVLSQCQNQPEYLSGARADLFFCGVNLVVALVCTTIALMPAIVSYLKYPDYPTFTFHTDDGLYLQRAVLSCSGILPYEWPYYETATPHSMIDVLLTRPNSIVDVVVGCTAVKFGLSLPQLGLGLDFICTLTSFLLLTTIFRLWVPRWVAYTAAMITLCLPHLFMTDWLYLLPNSTFPHLVNVNIVWRDSPATRSIYTQISYLPYLLSIYFLLKHGLGKFTNAWGLIAIGLIGGLVGHIYFFGWISCAAIGTGILCLKPLINRESHLNSVLRDLLLFWSGWVIGSLGSFYILLINRTTGIVKADVLGEYWFMPVERLILSGWLVLILFYRPKRDKDFPAALVGFLAVLLALNLPLLNIQPLLKQGMASYHFGIFYLNPLLAGGFFSLIYLFLDRFIPYKTLLKAFCLAPIAVIAHNTFSETKRAFDSTDWNRDLGWVIHEMGRTPSDHVFGMNSVNHPFSPVPPQSFNFSTDSTFVASLSHRFTLHQDWMYNEIDNDDDIRRELGLAWIISGRMQLLWHLPEKIDLPNDIFNQTWVYYQLRRQQKLALHGHLVTDYTPCKFLRDYRLDFLIFDTRDGDVLAKPEERFLSLQSVSPAGNFKIFDFDQKLAIDKFCNSSR